jgi:hypothetical protein
MSLDKPTVNAGLLYGGLVLALISIFLPFATQTISVMGMSLGEQDVPLNGAAKFIFILLIAATAWLAWPVLAKTVFSLNRIIGLSVAVGALALYVVYGFIRVGTLNSDTTSASAGLGLLLLLVAVVVIVVSVVRVWLTRRSLDTTA